ncbi:RNA polymerase sigma factor sigD, chloroplastic [Vitis vinifera]|uniref:RNA polymerase sigma factor sigD, chloroplastic n=1 Tax=Vitis vinifera TaxID=29760 RepID=A0A438DZ94_VITVI|nr:RNA polymerase sigma factor sigD, chloroplastic [Vitis vinifera]
MAIATAIAICSSPSQYSPALSSFQTTPSLKTLNHPPLLLPPCGGAVALASAAVEAARAAVWAAGEAGEEEGGGCRVVRVRRRRRRKRRRGVEALGMVDKWDGEEVHEVSFGAARSAVLTPREEAEFCLCLKEEAGLEAARRRIAETREHEPTSNQWAEAVGIKRSSLDKMLCNGRESRERINQSYRRLVVSIAARYQGKGLSLQDLIQEGSIGLLRGAERFDPDRGYKLSTYVYWWIRQAIVRAIANKSRIIRLPGSICEMVAKIAEARTVLSRRLRRLPTYDEIAEFIDVNVSTVRLVSERSRTPISVDQAVTSQGCMTLQTLSALSLKGFHSYKVKRNSYMYSIRKVLGAIFEIIPGPDETTPQKMVKRQLMKQEVERALNTLCEREAYILRLYFGINGETPLSFEEIGRLMKLSRERVRQINSIALSKLRQTSVVDYLKLYMM